jgi:hypothetical protein
MPLTRSLQMPVSSEATLVTEASTSSSAILRCDIRQRLDRSGARFVHFDELSGSKSSRFYRSAVRLLHVAALHLAGLPVQPHHTRLYLMNSFRHIHKSEWFVGLSLSLGPLCATSWAGGRMLLRRPSSSPASSLTDSTRFHTADPSSSLAWIPFSNARRTKRLEGRSAPSRGRPVWSSSTGSFARLR